MKFLFFGNVTLIVACCFYKKCMHKHTTKNMQFHTFMEPLTLLQPLTCMMFMTFCSKMKTFSTTMSMATTFFVISISFDVDIKLFSHFFIQEMNYATVFAKITTDWQAIKKSDTASKGNHTISNIRN